MGVWGFAVRVSRIYAENAIQGGSRAIGSVRRGERGVVSRYAVINSYCANQVFAATMPIAVCLSCE
jgi:hypothetical protein